MTNEVLTYAHDDDANLNGTRLFTKLHDLSFFKLVELLGEPQRLVDPDNSRVSWNVVFSDGEVLCIYDWNYGDVPVESVTQWNVAARDFVTAYRVFDIVRGNPVIG